MLNTAGKVFIRSRLAEAICAVGNLPPRQFGFRAGRCTIDDAMQVVDALHQAERYVLLPLMDIEGLSDTLEDEKRMDIRSEALSLLLRLL